MNAAISTHARQSGALTARSPAKINLTLEVLEKRGDGFHEIRSVVQGVELHDTLRFRAIENNVLRVSCRHPDVPNDDRNLITQAASAMAELYDEPAGVEIELEKYIPIAAGLGGGSGNAAATLVALNQLWKLHLPHESLARIGATIGSDVPLFLSLPSAAVSGRGEIAEPIHMTWHGWGLLVFAGCAVSTRAVYEAWSPGDCRGPAVKSPMLITQAVRACDVASQCVNDLEQAIFRVAPRVRELSEAIRSATGMTPRITGAGQTAYLLFDDPREGESVRKLLASKNIGVSSCLVSTMTGPMTIE